MKLSKNFTLDEFIESRFYDEEVQEGVWISYDNDCEILETNLQRLASNLQVLRDYVGKSVIINIAYRPSWYEINMGRSGTSQHCSAKAADIVVSGMTPDEVADTIEELILKDKMENGGLGRYDTFTHFDVRGYAARWDERK
tara:strand:+ start:877 stop:1299 length:423 start_codon:yes stop_codon:yes gene_type:complete